MAEALLRPGAKRLMRSSSLAQLLKISLTSSPPHPTCLPLDMPPSLSLGLSPILSVSPVWSACHVTTDIWSARHVATDIWSACHVTW